MKKRNRSHMKTERPGGRRGSFPGLLTLGCMLESSGMDAQKKEL